MISNISKEINTISLSNNKDNDTSSPEISEEPSSFYDNYKFQKGEMDNYEVHTKIGRGRYSEVFEGRNINTNKEVIVKILKPSKLFSFYYSKKAKDKKRKQNINFFKRLS